MGLPLPSMGEGRGEGPQGFNRIESTYPGMTKMRVTVRLDRTKLARAKRVLRAHTVTEAIEMALALVTEKAAHDAVIRRCSGVGGPKSFGPPSFWSGKRGA